MAPEMQREFINLRKMIDRDARLRRKCSDEVIRLWAEFSENHLRRCIALYGLIWAEAQAAADGRLEQFVIENADEFTAATGCSPLVG
jgi:hypothetical protein